MQMRFDGSFGFPGGIVDDTDISLEDALLRELREEMGNLPQNFEINTSDYIMSHLLEQKRYCLHFYAKEVPFNQYLEIEERNGKQAADGFEVFHFQMSFVSRTPANLWRISFDYLKIESCILSSNLFLGYIWLYIYTCFIFLSIQK